MLLYLFFGHGDSVQNTALWYGQVDQLSALWQSGRSIFVIVCGKCGGFGDYSGTVFLDYCDMARRSHMVSEIQREDGEFWWVK